VKAWRPFHRGMMIIEPRLGTGKTPAGLWIEVGLEHVVREDGRRVMFDRTKQTKMIGDVITTFGTSAVRPDDVVSFRYGQDHDTIDAQGEPLTFLHERHVIAILRSAPDA
jgi:hypothetical protein